MEQTLTVQTPSSLSKWTHEQELIIKRTIAPDLTNDEMVIFAYVCNRVRLDPFGKQIYAIKRGGKMCIQTSIDGFRLIAERTGRYAPGQDTEFLYDDKGKLIGAKVYVKKLTDDGTWHQISATAFLNEYDTGQGLWRKMPSVMVEKVAESRALRRAFPADLHGIYSADEMEQADSIFTDAIPKIGSDIVEKIESCINGYDDIRSGLLQICNVKSISDIKESQVEACRKYVMAQVKKKKLEKEGESNANN